MQRHYFKEYPSLEKRKTGSKDAEDVYDPVPTTTKADTSGDVSTMKRRLADKLFLLVRQRCTAGPGASPPDPAGTWTFPHTQHQAGETIRLAAERALKEAVGPREVFFIGNAPMAHLQLDTAAPPLPHGGSATAGSSGGSVSPLGLQASEAEASSSGGSGGSSGGGVLLFLHLAQVVNDPWEVLVHDEVASEHAWVAKDELGRYISDPRLLELAVRAL